MIQTQIYFITFYINSEAQFSWKLSHIVIPVIIIIITLTLIPHVMYELFYNTIGNTIYTGLLELKKGEVFNKDECDTYVYECIGGNHSRLAHQQILEENPDLNTDRHFSHRSVSIYVNLTEEQAQHLAHRHNRTTEFINVMTTQDKVT